MGSENRALELRDVTKRYGDFTAVQGLSLSVPSGCIFGFLGPNGAGKTTSIRMILEIIRPTNGTISVLGSPSSLAVRKRIGYLPEEKGLYKKMKAWAIIAYFATLKGVDSGTARRKAYELLERYGLGAFADKKSEALSKGMGQKVQLLAALAHDPEFVILDEPFSGLDPVNQEVLEEIVVDLRRRGRTVLFSTHVMAHAERLCDRLSIMAGGRKIFEGTPTEARALLPPRVRLRTDQSVAPLQQLAGVRGVRQLPDGLWELELAVGTDPQTILQACFEQRLVLRSFSADEPALHDVFVHLVGDEAREVKYR